MEAFDFSPGFHQFHTFIEAQNIVPSCGDNGNYAPNSDFERNLGAVFSYIPSTIGNSGFQSASLGISPDRVNVIALCRADLQLEACRSCISNATVEIRGFCPMNREAIVWRDFCTLRYSNESFFGIESQSPVGLLVSAPPPITSIQAFNRELNRLLDNLRGQAAAGGPLFKAAAGDRRGPDSLTAYALMQCTPDISTADCNRCLRSAAQEIPVCCNGVHGARVLFPSCMLRYEIYPFVNMTRIQEVQASLRPPSF